MRGRTEGVKFMEDMTRKPIPQKVEVIIEVTPPNGEFEKVSDLVKKICEAFQQDYTLRINVKNVSY